MLSDATDKLSQQEILQRWPTEDGPPDRTTLSRWLKRATQQGLTCCSGSGYRGDSFRYWRPGREPLLWPGHAASEAEKGREPLLDLDKTGRFALPPTGLRDADEKKGARRRKWGQFGRMPGNCPRPHSTPAIPPPSGAVKHRQMTPASPGPRNRWGGRRKDRDRPGRASYCRRHCWLPRRPGDFERARPDRYRTRCLPIGP